MLFVLTEVAQTHNKSKGVVWKKEGKRERRRAFNVLQQARRRKETQKHKKKNISWEDRKRYRIMIYNPASLK